MIQNEKIILGVAEVTRSERQEIEEQLLDFGVVGPGPRRTLNFIHNRRWLSADKNQGKRKETSPD